MSQETQKAKASSGGLAKSIKSSVKLSTLKFMSQVGLRLISTVVLTRLLAPEVYGVFAIVVLYRYLLEMFSDLGLRSVVLTKEGEVELPFLQTIWTVSVLRGLVIFIFTGFIAVIIAVLQAYGAIPQDSAYVSPVLPWAIFALGGTSLLDGLRTANRFTYERDMQFSGVIYSQIAGNVVALIVTVAAAWWLRSVWALVIGAYCQTLVMLVLNQILFEGPRMRWRLHRPSLRIIIDRGKWIIGHSSLTALTQAADRLVLGLIMSSSTFGFYFIARQIVDIGMTFLNTAHGQMGLQVFRHINDGTTEAFRTKYYKYRLFFDALAGIGAGAGFVLVQDLVDLVFDDRYADVGPLAELLIFSLVPVGFLLLREAFSAERKFREMTLLSLLSAVTLWCGLLLCAWLNNIPAAILVIALHRVPEAVVYWWLAVKRDWLILWREGLVVVFFALGMGLGWLLLSIWEIWT